MSVNYYETRILDSLQIRNNQTHRELINLIAPEDERYSLSHGVTLIATIAKLVKDNKVVINSDQTVSLKS